MTYSVKHNYHYNMPVFHEPDSWTVIPGTPLPAKVPQVLPDNNHNLRMEWMDVFPQSGKPLLLELRIIQPPDQDLIRFTSSPTIATTVTMQRPAGDGPFEPIKDDDANVQTKHLRVVLERRGLGTWTVDNDIGRGSVVAFLRVSLVLENAKESHDYIVEGSLRFQGVDNEFKLPRFGVRCEKDKGFPSSLFMPKTTGKP